MSRIAAIVVLYNPETSVLDNLNSYVNQVEKIYTIDNSEHINSSVVDKIKCIKKVEYISKGLNMGIASALNTGAKKAIEDGFEYILTMDQDSKASSSLVSNLLLCFLKDSKIALVSPILQHPKGRNIKYESMKSCEQVFTTWTSGNLVDLNIFKLSGGYKENFFIDYVDHEFCLRLNNMGFKIYLCYKTFLIHNLGKIEEKNLIFRKVYPTNHSALRLYYRARNRFYVKKIYKNIFPDFFIQDNKDFWRSFLKMVLFEKGKLKKIKFFILGFIDYKKNKFGKFNLN